MGNGHGLGGRGSRIRVDRIGAEPVLLSVGEAVTVRVARGGKRTDSEFPLPDIAELVQVPIQFRQTVGMEGKGTEQDPGSPGRSDATRLE